MSGKGDKQRQGNSEKLINNWDRIFGKKKGKDVDTSEVEPFHISNARYLKMQDIKYKDKLAKDELKKQEELFDRIDKEVEDDQKRESKKQ
mgnify:FL=1|tara:strand:- start:34 stop:303 length:270 start_codon:yes stop_codon:yes gene_type:complete